MKNCLIEKLLKSTPLEQRLNIDNEMMFIDLITVLGYREDKMWSSDEDDILQKICDKSKELTKRQLETIEEWKNDGCPK